MYEQILVPGHPASHEEHLAQQQTAQERKKRTRHLYAYDRMIFCQGLDDNEVLVGQNLGQVGYEDSMDLKTLLESMYRQRGGKLQVVDMGAGTGVAMRELAIQPDLEAKLETTIVDLFAVGSEAFTDFNRPGEDGIPVTMSPEATPKFIQADAEKVVLDEPADVILSVESIQYLNNPLVAIINWYNQLADGGLMIIAREGDFATYMHYKDGQADKQGQLKRSPDNSLSDPYTDPSPLVDLLKALDTAGVKLIAMNGDADGQEFPYNNLPTGNNPILTSLVIRKKPGTLLSLNTSLTEVRLGEHNFNNCFYEAPDKGRPLVEVVDLGIPIPENAPL